MRNRNKYEKKFGRRPRRKEIKNLQPRLETGTMDETENDGRWTFMDILLSVHYRVK